MAFLPMTAEECRERGFDEPDFVLVTGDAYVDHPSFGAALIGKLLESRGYKVAVIAQPEYKNANDFKRFGRPKLAFLISGGNVDSMVNNYSVFKNKRKADVYSPGGKAGKRPDRAVIVYSNRAKEAYKGVPVIIGGLEASLRRFAHYDYWENKVRRSILLDSKADLLVYGMGEKSICEIAEALESGIAVRDITWVKGTCFRAIGNAPAAEGEDATGLEWGDETLMLPGFIEIVKEKKKYCGSFAEQYRNNCHIKGKRLAEGYGGGLFVLQNPPMPPLDRFELDDLYELPFERSYHPAYEVYGGVPAIEEVEFSITGSRGCFGGCSFCALTSHQGKQVRSRSKGSILKEAESFTKKPGFKGYIHDVGGPTANFRGAACEKQLKAGSCTDRDCLNPDVCPNLKADHSEFLEILGALREIAGVKKVFIRSGIRFDYLMADKNGGVLEEICKHNVSGVLKVAPEHVSERALSAMRKPGKESFERFSAKFNAINEKLGLKQYIRPYFISSHPGSALDDAVELALYLKETRFVPDQVQDFYPTPGTISTCMYYTGLDPFTMKKVYVPDTPLEKKMQRALLHFNKPENSAMVETALEKAGKPELKRALLGGRALPDKRAPNGRKGKNEYYRKPERNNKRSES